MLFKLFSSIIFVFSIFVIIFAGGTKFHRFANRMQMVSGHKDMKRFLLIQEEDLSLNNV